MFIPGNGMKENPAGSFLLNVCHGDMTDF